MKKTSNSNIRKTLVINTVGVLVILFLSDPDESYSGLFYFFNTLFVFINVFLIIFINRLGKKINIFVLALAGLVAFFTAYDYYVNGSQTVYIIWIFFGFLYLGLAFFKEYPKLKVE